jgi:hypothetical protein
MKSRIAGAFIFTLTFSALLFAQGSLVIVDPTVKFTEKAKLSAADQSVFDRDALPKYKTKYGDGTCNVEPEIAGVVRGAFTRAGAKQTLVFFQVCQTGNGLGIVGITVIENGKVVGTFGADTGWTLDAGVLPDINGNGLNEFTLSYGGGMHQGQGGVGVDIVEFSGGLPKGLGWFKAEEFTDTEPTAVWRVTANPGKSPVYFSQKFTSSDDVKWQKAGGITPLKLTNAVGSFEIVK